MHQNLAIGCRNIWKPGLYRHSMLIVPRIDIYSFLVRWVVLCRWHNSTKVGRLPSILEDILQGHNDSEKGADFAESACLRSVSQTCVPVTGLGQQTLCTESVFSDHARGRACSPEQESVAREGKLHSQKENSANSTSFSYVVTFVFKENLPWGFFSVSRSYGQTIQFLKAQG